MIGTFVYLLACQGWNRVRSQVRRLRQPKYLAAAAAGFLYFYWFFIRGMFMSGPGASPFRSADAVLGVEWARLWEVLGAMGLAAMVVVAWLFPKKRAVLDFTEAEVAFLFPAPVRRTSLVHFKVLRGQLGILFGALLMMFFSARSVSGPLWVRLLAWWTLIAALELHRLGAAFARTRLLDRGITTGRRRFWVLATVAVGVSGFLGWAGWAGVMPVAADWGSAEAMAAYVRRVSDSGPVFWLLLPFRVMVRPLLAESAGAFLAVILPAWGVLAALYVWVIRSTVAFEEASLERAGLRARAQAAVRSGNWQILQGLKPRRDPFRLGPAGLPELGFLWKNLIAAGSTFSIRFWVSLGVGLLVAAIAMKGAMRDSAGLPVIGLLLLMFMGMSLVMGPQVVAFDLRQSLGMVEFLKTLPLAGWRLVLGEVAAPCLVLTGVQWFLVALATSLWSGPSQAGWGAALRIGLALALALVMPGLNLVTLLIHNGAALVFPGWTRFGAAQSHGFEAMGRNILLMVGVLVTMALALVVPGLAAAAVFFALRSFLPLPLVAPLCAVAALGVLLAEGYSGLRMLGDQFERMDISEEPVGGAG